MHKIVNLCLTGMIVLFCQGSWAGDAAEDKVSSTLHAVKLRENFNDLESRELESLANIHLTQVERNKVKKEFTLPQLLGGWRDYQRWQVNQTDLKRLSAAADAGIEAAIGTLIRATERGGLGIKKDEKEAHALAKRYTDQGSHEAFVQHMVFERVKNPLAIYEKANWPLIEAFACKGSECARGYFVSIYQLGGIGRIEIDEREQRRTQALIDQFAEEGSGAADESQRYIDFGKKIQAIMMSPSS